MEKKLSVFKHCFKFGKVVEKAENYKTIKFEYEGQKFTVYSIKKPIRKSTIIYCEGDGTIYREQLYGLLRFVISDRTVLIKPPCPKDEIAIVLFSGVPNFRNLDDGIFVSAKSKMKDPSSIYVMTKSAFKSFSLEYR